MFLKLRFLRGIPFAAPGQSNIHQDLVVQTFSTAITFSQDFEVPSSIENQRNPNLISIRDNKQKTNLFI